MLSFSRSRNIRILEKKNRLINDSNRELHMLNESLEKFAQITSHDLKAPIRSIGHLATFIKEDEPNLSEESKQNLHYIQSSVESSNNLILNMLALAKSSDKNIELEDVNTKEVFNLVESNLLETILETRTELNYKGNLPVIKGNLSLLTQLFQNIIQNAIKYTPEKINPVIEVEVFDSKINTTFLIKDNGIGIKEEKRESLFSAFSQESFNSIEGGVGLGLYITKKIADVHNAKVRVEPNVNQGTIFKIIFIKE